MTAQLPPLGRADQDLAVLPRMANRHGLIAGATGTGKTVTLQVLAEDFSELGVPVFLPDVKGDLAGISRAGTATPPVTERLARLGVSGREFRASPTVFWDVYGSEGHPLRATVSDMGPLLLGRLLSLSEVQQQVLEVLFRMADDQGLLLLDLKDLTALVEHASSDPKSLGVQYGQLSPQSLGALRRALAVFEGSGAAHFFGEPAFQLEDLLRPTEDGRGRVHVLAASRLFQSPVLYTTVLLWLLSELFEELPEVGDLERPKIVFFFDEAHLLFEEAPKPFLDKVEQVVRLVRSRGVGVYFITQNPTDLPADVLSQLGNRIQHALRAFTEKDRKAIKAAAQNFRLNPGLKIDEALTLLGTGEALVSLLDESGQPGLTQRALIYPPRGRIGTITAEERAATMQASVLGARYATALDRESAYEMLKKRAGQRGTPQSTETGRGRPRGVDASDMLTQAARSAVRAMGSQIGRQIVRGILGSVLGGSRRR